MEKLKKYRAVHTATAVREYGKYRSVKASGKSKVSTLTIDREGETAQWCVKGLIFNKITNFKKYKIPALDGSYPYEDKGNTLSYIDVKKNRWNQWNYLLVFFEDKKKITATSCIVTETGSPDLSFAYTFDLSCID